MPSKRARFLVALFAALCLLAASAACSRSNDDEEDAEGGGDSAEVAAQTPYKPTGQEGSIAGTISFAGSAPAKKGISMDADPVCASSNPDPHAEDIVVNGDKLQNVFVYIKEGTAGGKNISGYSFPPPTQPATLDQKGCHYVPHVVGVQVNQTFNVTNSDPTAHNVNVDARQNEKFNQGQSPGAAPIVKQFKRAETVIPVKCNQHPWMRAYVGVLQHPFFAVTDASGKFEIKGVPAGTYTLVAWHEKYPQGLTQSVTVGASEAKTADFSFTAQQLVAESLEGGALRVMPALDLPMLGGHH
ncbi:MAG TPA: carboxypeptidase regulatory-like domain-containing protein [Pyrinomonadaceae bacterium]|nr:carboxypeptidase regulatory-like domain-containing protein [Pyrinomonadaceae bacterium]